MNPVQSIKNSDMTSIAEHDNENTQQVTGGRPRSDITYNQILSETSTSLIYNRELSLETNPCLKASPCVDTYGEAVGKKIKLITIKVIDAFNRVLERKRKKSYKIVYNKSDPLEEIMRKFLDSFTLISQNYPNYEKDVTKIGIEGSNDVYSELDMNAQFCWETLIMFCAERIICDEKETSFLSTIQFTETTDDIHPDEINPVINKAIRSLKTIKEKCYYPLLNIMMDQELDLKSKYVKLLKCKEGREPNKSELAHFQCIENRNPKQREIALKLSKLGMEQQVNDALRNQSIAHFKSQLTYQYLHPLASHVRKLQDLINILHKVQNSPKTIKNLVSILKLVNVYCEFFVKEVNVFSHDAKNLSSQCYQDYLMIKTFFFDLKKQIHEKLTSAIMKRASALKNEIEANEQRSPTVKVKEVPVEQNPVAPKHKRKKRRIRNVEKIEPQTKEPKIVEANNDNKKNEAITAKPENNEVIESIIIPTSPREKSVKSRLPKEENIIFEKIKIEGPELKDRKVIQKPEEKEKLKSFIKDNQPPVKNLMSEELHEKSFDEEFDEEIFDAISEDSFDTSDDSLGDIEREANVLMEILRQIYEKDRKDKLERKEAKIKKAILLEHEVTKTSSIKLSTKHQETLNNLFLKHPPHFEISGSEVESLIKILRGRIVGAGGSMVSVFWGNSKKKAGEYEVFHGGDGEGYLKSAWAGRAAEAIRVGVQYGYIAKETIHPHL